MKVLVIGGGGREHALCKKIKTSPLVQKIFAAPGNAGMCKVAQLLPYQETEQAALKKFVAEEEIDLVIIGPEKPLSEGLTDHLLQTGAKIFAPTKAAAEIESRKSFAKDLMKKYGVPTGDYDVFTDYALAADFVQSKGAPIVIKADGLAAGKGVVVARSIEEALCALREMLQEKKFGIASSKVVVEEFLVGEEFSLMALVHGEIVIPLAAAKDYKRAFDGDRGPNTGGMGAYSPLPQFPPEVMEESVQTILLPIARALVKEGRPFTGVLYGGIMQTKTGPQVIEFNARFGDPETQVILPRMESDLIEVILGLLKGEAPHIIWSDKAMLGVIVASEGYPTQGRPGAVLGDLKELDELEVFYGGVTRNEQGHYLTTGGRSFLAAALADSVEEAQAKVYSRLAKLSCRDVFYRKDIGKDVMKGS